jgi:hypothetical protein
VGVLGRVGFVNAVGVLGLVGFLYATGLQGRPILENQFKHSKHQR